MELVIVSIAMILYSVLGAIAILLPIWGAFFFASLNRERLNFIHIYFFQSILKKWDKKLNSMAEDEWVIMDYDSFLRVLNPLERALVKRLYSINPAELGFTGPFYSKEKPGRLVKLDSVEFKTSGKPRSSGVQYCPAHSYEDFKQMAEDYFNETGRKIFIDSGYRSPGRQAYVFIRSLVRNNGYSLNKTAKWVAMPGFSEHGSPVNNAVDISNEEGINGFSDDQVPEDFEKTPEYDWLRKNAINYNFYLSYPRDNEHGVGYEPWHWHWEKKGGEA